jgi:hypothetical protein
MVGLELGFSLGEAEGSREMVGFELGFSLGTAEGIILGTPLGT